MPSNRGISFSVSCRGRDLDEYAVQATDERTVSCFIPSQAEKDFEIILTNTLEGQDVVVEVTVDNSAVGRYFLAPGEKSLPGIYVSETLMKPFRFRNLIFNDEKSVHDPSCFSYDNMGSIDFAVYRCRRTGVEQFRPSQEPEDRKPSRGGTPILLTGEGKPIKAVGNAVGGQIMDPETKPYAKMLFRYRPLEILQMQGIAPTPAVSPTVESAYGSDYSNSRPTTASSASTAVSFHEQPFLSKKRSFDATVFDANPRPTQKMREPNVADVHSRSAPMADYKRQQAWNASMPAFDVLGSGTAEELTLMKAQLRHATDQMNNAMSQMQGAMELMNRSTRQIQFLQQRIEVIESRRLPPLSIPAYQAEPQPPAFYAAAPEHQLTQEVGIYPPLLHTQEPQPQWTQDFHTGPISPESPWV